MALFGDGVEEGSDVSVEQQEQLVLFLGEAVFFEM